MPLIDFDAASEWEMLLFHQRPVLGRQPASRFLTASAIRHRLRTSRWQQPHRAVYVTTTGELTWSQMRWVATSPSKSWSPTVARSSAAQWTSSDHEARMLIAMSFQQRVVGLTAIDAAGDAHSLAELEFLRFSRSA